jgi:hypothetical protein
MGTLPNPRPIDQRCAGQGNDADIILVGLPGCSPALDTGSPFPLAIEDLATAREFARRGDKDGFARWVALHTCYTQNQDRLRQEYRRAEAEALPSWKHVWRTGIVPQVSTEGLQRLRRALLEDDSRVLTGSTCFPPPLQCCEDERVERCCPVCWLILAGKSPEAISVGLLDEAFARLCWEADKLCGQPMSIRYLLNWIDETPRPELRKQLIVECDLALAGRMPAETETPLAKRLAASIRHEQAKKGEVA